MDKTGAVVLCCEMADAPSTIRGAVFHHKCRCCDRNVMVSPSGQEFLKVHPQTQIICKHCWWKEERPGVRYALSGNVDTVANELRNTVPNLWKERN